MIQKIFLKFTGGYLRPLMPADVHPGHASGLNDPEVRPYLDGVKRVMQSVAEFVQHNHQFDNAVLFGIRLEIGCNCCTIHHRFDGKVLC